MDEPNPIYKNEFFETPVRGIYNTSCIAGYAGTYILIYISISMNFTSLLNYKLSSQPFIIV